MIIDGAGFLEITSVALSVVDPVESFAVKPIGTPVTISAPTSLIEGVPKRVREPLSNESHLGPLERVYVMDESEEKVELGKV